MKQGLTYLKIAIIAFVIEVIYFYLFFINFFGRNDFSLIWHFTFVLGLCLAGMIIGFILDMFFDFLRPRFSSIVSHFLLMLTLTCLYIKWEHDKYLNVNSNCWKWNNHVKSTILSLSNMTMIEEDTSYSAGETNLIIRGWLDNKLVYEKYRNRSNPGGLERYFYWGGFELRREICNNGNVGFEGILYNHAFYGYSRWWNCNGQLETIGMRFASKEIGNWEYYTATGKLKEIKHFNEMMKIDAMPEIHDPSYYTMPSAYQTP